MIHFSLDSASLYVVPLLRSWPQLSEACGDGFLPKRGYYSASLIHEGLQSTGIDSGFSPILLILCRWTNENVTKNGRAQEEPPSPLYVVTNIFPSFLFP